MVTNIKEQFIFKGSVSHCSFTHGINQMNKTGFFLYDYAQL